MEKKNEPTTTTKKKKVKRDTISRQRVEQIQKSGIGEMRKRLYEMGITCMADIK
jgi:Fe2+ transport system protein FeoA